MSTTSDVVERRPAGRDAADHHRRLLVAGEQARREAVAPLDLAEERLAVLRVAHGARRDAERPLGAERLELPPVVGEAVPHARDRDGEEAPPLVDALAEPRDREPPRDLLELRRRRRPRRGAGSSSSRGRPLRRGSSRRGGTPAASACGAARASSEPSSTCELRARDAQALGRRLQVLACARSASARSCSVRAERSSKSASSLVIALPVRLPCSPQGDAADDDDEEPDDDEHEPDRGMR